MSKTKSCGRILHIVPTTAIDPQQKYLGSTKDARGRTEYFETRGIPFDEIVASRSDTLLVETLRSTDLSFYSTVFFEMALYPTSLRYLRIHHPHLRLLTRSINAEFFHRLHYLAAGLRHNSRLSISMSLKGYARLMRQSIQRLRMDYLCAKESDYILSITQWEKEHYWNYLTEHSKIRNVPYFLPEVYCSSSHSSKKMQCVCLMSTAQATLPLNWDAAENMNYLVKKLGSRCKDWNFSITGYAPSNIHLPDRVKSVGLLSSPFDILAESRAMSLLSDYGFGFKTKLLDAVSQRCYILLTPRLYSRQPEELRPYCILVHRNSVSSFIAALERCQQPFPKGSPNHVLRDIAFTSLDEIIYNT